MGFWSEVGEWGQEQIQREAQRRMNQGGQSAHIAAQNEANAELSQILNDYHAGIITNASAQQLIQATATGFRRIAETLGYPRALQGSLEITTLASRIAADLRAETSGGILGAGMGDSSNMLLIGAAMLALFVFTRGKR